MRHLKLATLASLIVGVPAAQAEVTLYEKDNFRLGLGGDFQVQYREYRDPSEDGDVEFDDMELQFFPEYVFHEKLTIKGRLDYDFKDEIDNDENVDSVDEATVGFNYNELFEFRFGKTQYAVDDFSISKDYELGGTTAFYNTAGDDVFVADVTYSDFFIRSSVDIGEGDENGLDDETSVDVLAKYAFLGGYEFGGAYQHFSAGDEIREIDESVNAGGQDAPIRNEIIRADTDDIFGFFFTADFNQYNVPVTAGFSYSRSDLFDDNYQVSVDYTFLEDFKLGAGWERFATDSEIGDFDADQWYVNLTYSFNDNVALLTEMGDIEVSEERRVDVDGIGDSDIGYLFGLRVRF